MARVEWPDLPYDQWSETRDTLHRWTQVVGKIRLALTPLVNHWWNVPLYVSARGLTTSGILYEDRSIDIEFDFVDHVLRIRSSDGRVRDVALRLRTVADFYADVFRSLQSMDVHCTIWPVPVEIPGETTPLDSDERHHHYDPEFANRFWRVLALCNAALTKFRGKFIGKCSPVQFYWGSFDLAVTRFSGRPAPPREGADSITREAYSHEVSSVGFWPGDARLKTASFFSYAAPEPAGYRDARIPAPAYYHPDLGGFYLHYDDVRSAADPEAMILNFCQATYDAAATLGAWDRAALERSDDPP
jgi:hypothetical protein